MSTEVHPVDAVLPVPKLLMLGLQHVLVMYAGAVAVPLILGRALKLSPEEVAFLISADLFACGIATLVQCVGFPGVGIRLPVMMGVTFASVGPMLSMAATPEVDASPTAKSSGRDLLGNHLEARERARAE
jgi:uric acid transporter